MDPTPESVPFTVPVLLPRAEPPAVIQVMSPAPGWSILYSRYQNLLKDRRYKECPELVNSFIQLEDWLRELALGSEA